MTTVEELRAAIREDRITADERKRLIQALGEIAFRLWYDKLDEAKARRAVEKDYAGQHLSEDTKKFLIQQRINKANGPQN